VSQKGVDEKIKKHLPGYMPMMEKGMGQMHDMGRPKNTLPMMTGQAQFGDVEMGGMFTVMKIRDELPKGYDADPGWYQHPAGKIAYKLK
jgi:manganese oxidase